MLSIGEEEAAALGDQTRVGIVRLLYSRGALTAAEIAAIVGKHRSTVSRHLAKLLRAGLVERVESRDGFLYELTERGREIAQALEAGTTFPVVEMPVRRYRCSALSAAKRLLEIIVPLFFAAIGVAGFLAPVRVHVISRLIWLFAFMAIAYLSKRVLSK